METSKLEMARALNVATTNYNFFKEKLGDCFKSRLSASDRKELNRLNNLRIKADKNYFGYSV